MPQPFARSQQRMESGPLTRWDAPPFVVRAHHLLCAVCVRGGRDAPAQSAEPVAVLLDSLWEYPFLRLELTADLDVNRGHYFDAYAGRGQALPQDFAARRADYAGRRKDLEVLRLLGAVPDSVIPAYTAYTVLFQRAPSLSGICVTDSPPSADWPECPNARTGAYESVAGERIYGLDEQTELGEALDGRGIWALVRPRTRAEMAAAKAQSAKAILEADRLFIRPNHLLCILCTADICEPLVQDNLIELRQRMEADPRIPVTLTEGCCMVCDPCNVYHPAEHLCYHGHIKNQLRDLHILERLGLRPGATLPAAELYALIYARIGSLREVCAWGDELSTAPFWGACGGWTSGAYERARARGLIAGRRCAGRAFDGGAEPLV